MFIKRSQIKEFVANKVSKALAEQQKIHDKELMDLEARVRGECEINLQSKDADIDILTLKNKEAEQIKKDAEDVYYKAWDIVVNTSALQGKAELYYKRLESSMVNALQAVRLIGKEIEKNKQTLIDSDEDFRRKLALNGNVKKISG
jgi:hypothetical protein